jgi:hypothetical protein
MTYENGDVLSRPELNDATDASMLIMMKVTMPAVLKIMCGTGVKLATPIFNDFAFRLR